MEVGPVATEKRKTYHLQRQKRGYLSNDRSVEAGAAPTLGRRHRCSTSPHVVVDLAAVLKTAPTERMAVSVIRSDGSGKMWERKTVKGSTYRQSAYRCCWPLCRRPPMATALSSKACNLGPGRCNLGDCHAAVTPKAGRYESAYLIDLQQ